MAQSRASTSDEVAGLVSMPMPSIGALSRANAPGVPPQSHAGVIQTTRVQNVAAALGQRHQIDRRPRKPPSDEPQLSSILTIDLAQGSIDRLALKYSEQSRRRSMSVVVEYVIKPNPGSDLKAILEMTHESAALWRKDGGKVRLWAVTAGEVGDFILSVSFDNFAAYGATFDKLNADLDYQAWHAKRLKLEAATWVRGTIASEILIGR
jgi:hypothetical protein